MRIGQLAQQTGSTTKTIRYYEQIGVMPEPERMPSGYRDYDPGAVHQLGFIQSAQAAGLTLSEIQTIIAIGTTGSPTCEHVEGLVKDKIADIDKRMTTLQRTRAELTRLLQDAQNLQPAQCGDGTICHILYDPSRRSASLQSFGHPTKAHQTKAIGERRNVGSVGEAHHGS